jgi:hypothetical protein
LSVCIERGLKHVRAEQEAIHEYIADIKNIAATLEPENARWEERQEKFKTLIDRFRQTKDPIRLAMAKVMTSFQPGIFAGEDTFTEIRDNLDLERWFRLPKSHERKIHGRRHAGVRLVQDGPTLVMALDAHAAHPEPFGAADLIDYRGAQMPADQHISRHRRKTMRKGRSKKQRPLLLMDLERRYKELR